jgi:hypothetical protein
MTIRLLIFSLAVLPLAGCATRGLYDAGGAAAGGVVAGELSHGNPLITAGGAAGGALATDLVQQGIEKSKDNVKKDQYNLGRSDAVKQQYWIIQRQQESLRSKPRPRVDYLPVPSPTGGAPTEYIRVEDRP